MASNGNSNPTSSKELLNIEGDGSKEAIIESLFNKTEPQDKPNIFKVARSPLFDQLQSFLPSFKSANEVLLQKSTDELDQMDVENTDDCDKVIEMNVVLGEVDENKASVFENEDCSSDSSDSDDDSAIAGTVSEDNINLSLSGKKNKSLIEAMESDSEESTATTDSGVSR